MSGSLRLLLLVAALLFALLLVDRFYRDDPYVTMPSPATDAGHTSGEAEAGPALPEALADHPLFQPSRKAVEAMVVAPAVMPEPMPEPAPESAIPEAEPVLLGVVTDPPPGGAFVGDTAGGPVVYLTPGGESRGLHLVSVQKDRAVFHGAAGDVTLLLPSAIELGK